MRPACCCCCCNLKVPRALPGRAALPSTPEARGTSSHRGAGNMSYRSTFRVGDAVPWPCRAAPCVAGKEPLQLLMQRPDLLANIGGESSISDSAEYGELSTRD